jgi:hypothetical protein
MVRPTRPLRAGLTLVGLALLAACSDELVAPRATPYAPASRSASGQPAPISNTVKYRDTGARPATGRAGPATLSVQALLGKTGETELEVTAGVADGAEGPATLEKVQAKHFAPEGSFIRTVNHNALSGSARTTLVYTGLERGGAVQVQANVRVPGRTGVVTVTETVHLRPDLRASLNAPSQVVAGLPVTITAVVTEGNGDVGARGDCVFYVDGAESDRANGVWVDAGGVVTCAFVHTFTGAGTHALRVQVENVAPGDFDPANNGASGTVQVTAPGNDFYYHAWVEDAVDHSVSTAAGRWEHGNPAWVFVDHQEEWTWDIHFQETGLYAWIPSALSLPLTRVEISGSTGGTIVDRATYTDVSGTEPGWESGQECVFRNSGGGYLSVCTQGTEDDGLSIVSYSRVAGDVTYHSRGAQEVWYQTPGDGYYYTFNYGDSYTYGGSILTFGDDYTLNVAVTDADRTWTANATVALGAPETIPYTSYPPSGEWCGVEYYPFDQVFHGCRTHNGVTLRRRGDAWGSPD